MSGDSSIWKDDARGVKRVTEPVASLSAGAHLGSETNKSVTWYFDTEMHCHVLVSSFSMHVLVVISRGALRTSLGLSVAPGQLKANSWS